MRATRPMNGRSDFGSTKSSIHVAAVLDQWYGQDGIFFKVRADDGNLYILRQQTSSADGTWDLVSFRDEKR